MLAFCRRLRYRQPIKTVQAVINTSLRARETLLPTCARLIISSFLRQLDAHWIDNPHVPTRLERGNGRERGKKGKRREGEREGRGRGEGVGQFEACSRDGSVALGDETVLN